MPPPNVTQLPDGNFCLQNKNRMALLVTLALVIATITIILPFTPFKNCDISGYCHPVSKFYSIGGGVMALICLICLYRIKWTKILIDVSVRRLIHEEAPTYCLLCNVLVTKRMASFSDISRITCQQQGIGPFSHRVIVLEYKDHESKPQQVGLDYVKSFMITRVIADWEQFFMSLGVQLGSVSEAAMHPMQVMQSSVYNPHSQGIPALGQPLLVAPAQQSAPAPVQPLPPRGQGGFPGGGYTPY